MRVLVTYDICDERRLRRVAKITENFGMRVQKSVFECDLNEKGITALKTKLASEMELSEDSVRLYRLCGRCREAIEVLGVGVIRDDDDIFVI